MDIITLLADCVRGLLDAEDQFIQDLGQFPGLEQTVSNLSRIENRAHIEAMGYVSLAMGESERSENR